MHYHFIIHEDPGQLWAECIELNGCQAQGKNKDDLLLNMKHALDGYLNVQDTTHWDYPLPLEQIEGNDIVKVQLEGKAALVLRQHIYRVDKM